MVFKFTFWYRKQLLNITYKLSHAIYYLVYIAVGQLWPDTAIIIETQVEGNYESVTL